MAYSKEPSPEVAAAKRDMTYLKRVLNVQSDKQSDFSAHCPLCDGKGCLQYGMDKKRVGDVYWHCNKCGAGGDVIEAVRQVVCSGDYKSAFARVKQDFNGRTPQPSAYQQYHQQRNASIDNGSYPSFNGNGSHPPPEPERKAIEPVLDVQRAEEFIAKANKHLLNNFDYSERYRRGLSPEVCEKMRVGFVEHTEMRYAPWQPPWTIESAWVLPITDAAGALKGVKFHCEKLPTMGNTKFKSKAIWAPFGTEPKYEKRTKTDDSGNKVVEEIKSRHAYQCLWPHPDLIFEPKTLYDFSMDMQWYLDRLTPELKRKWDNEVEGIQIELKYELGITGDLSSPDVYRSWEIAFSRMKKQIMESVCKGENQSAARYDRNQAETDWSKYTFICPGELKALAVMSGGGRAAGPTGGESWMPSQSELSSFQGRMCCLFYDDDPPKKITIKKPDGTETSRIVCAGLLWASKWAEALKKAGASFIVAKSGGRKPKEEE